ncbi:acyl-CoA dehydrogenase family protein [Amycolatopsis thermophila]|uniref:Alkylation response protein AidB-like acyl-CoA dehydrogenase n=1 Tax=Amycolatopsis thermophila TaxID=206084 RepID=A0ABU0F6U9_9PSEU|nr:acyl-CoA dehydrogenase family protein [Amycolatopsis thermophila]MDQ0382836.1 alkylation response protein AidB-like acyl-CoA dehydrogenase [Amycolatopsis thermophila]
MTEVTSTSAQSTGEFRAELSAWLDANLPEGWGTPAFRMPKGAEPRREFIRDLQRRMAADRWIAIHWPAEFGGRGATMDQQIAYHAELARRGVPRPLGHIGLNLCGPTIIRHGTDWQRERFLRPMLVGEEIWCEGFSEPGAGSDLAGLRTRGRIEGDEMVIEGQKTWNTGGHYAQWMFALVRTDPDAPKHKGLSFVLIPMDAPGVTVRPIERICREHDINDVFLDSVRIPLTHVVGPLHGGWGVTRTTLNHERYTQFLASQIGFRRTLDKVVDLARRTSPLGKRPADRPEVRSALARKWIASELIRLHGLRNIASVQSSGEPGPEGAIMKAFGQEQEKQLHELAMDLSGAAGLLDRGSGLAPDRGKWVFGYLRSRASTIAGGTSEIQRNVIAERVLGMPRDPWLAQGS